MNITNFNQAVDEYVTFVDQIWMLYYDAVYGFEKNKQMVIKQQYEIAHNEATAGRPTTIRMLDQKLVLQRFVPSGGAPPILHTPTQREFRERNGIAGPNANQMALMCTETLYNHWEDHYRKAIATALGIAKNDVKIAIMGDLAKLRHAVVHNANRATEDVEKRCVELCWFRRGDHILIDMARMGEIIQRVKSGVRAFGQQYDKVHMSRPA